MEITDIKIRKIHLEGRLKAIISVTFDDALVVHDVKVVEGDKGIFVAMPSKKTPTGEYKDIVHPISRASREKIQAEILQAYQEARAIMDWEEDR